MPARTLPTFSVAAQNYPSKAMRLVSPFPPGGSVDVVGRMLAAKLTESLGQQMIVDNRSGASGIIGTELVAKAPPDGYTLLINTLPLVTNQFLMAAGAVRPDARLRTDLDGDVVAVAGHGASVGAGALDQGTDRARAFQAGPAQLLRGRRWHQSAHRRRAFQPARWHKHGRRAVQGRRARGHCGDRRRSGRHVRQRLAGSRLREIRPAARARGDEHDALPGPAGSADGRRGRRPGIRVPHVARDPRAQGNAGVDREPAQRAD